MSPLRCLCVTPQHDHSRCLRLQPSILGRFCHTPAVMWTPRPNEGETLKIYRVAAGGSSQLWTNYQSAAQSHAYWLRRHPDAQLLTVHVPDEAWKPVDKLTEARLSRVATLWEQLAASDQQGLDSLLDELVKRVQPPKPAPKPAPTLRDALDDAAKREAAALLDMDRLVKR